MLNGAHRVGVIDVGTNSSRLLVADVSDGRISPLERRSRVTRLGRGVDLSGQLSAEAIEEVCGAIGEYVGVIEEMEVERVEAIATSAVRDASNGSAFVAELRERFALSARVLDGELELDRLSTLDDEEAIAEISAVRGLGRWTAEMFLLFHLGRPDVISGGDLGIRKAIMIEFGLPAMPTPKEVEERAVRWSPNRSLASLYLWESLHAVPD